MPSLQSTERWWDDSDPLETEDQEEQQRSPAGQCLVWQTDFSTRGIVAAEPGRS